MVFSNLFFLYIFLPLLLILYFIGKDDAYRRGVLIVFSLLFYAWGEPICVFVMIGLVLLDYAMGLLISRADTKSMKKTWLVVAVIANLGVLCFYKYLGFFIENINTVFRTSLPTLDIKMPIGISFFTFQTMSYVIDVYRGDTEVQRSFSKLLLYVSLFPQLIAGPIVRYKDIEMQLDNRHVTAEKINDGLFRFAIGLGKKAVIADACAVAVKSLNDLADVTLLGRWTSAVFFTLQLYFDFSGYSDMAIGLGKMFGFDFLENFNYPLTATSATDFWRRWHMSLGSFFRDYVYIPLGGNRRMQWRNIIIVWFLTGLWHGASWNFVLWGLYYAVLLVIEKKFLLGVFKKMGKGLRFVVTHLYTIFITVFGFAIFYFEKDLFKNLGYLFGVGCKGFTDIFTNAVLVDNIVLFIAAALLACPIFKALTKPVRDDVPYEYSRIIKTLVVIALIGVSTIKLVGDTYSPFLYFRF